MAWAKLYIQGLYSIKINAVFRSLCSCLSHSHSSQVNFKFGTCITHDGRCVFTWSVMKFQKSIFGHFFIPNFDLALFLCNGNVYIVSWSRYLLQSLLIFHNDTSRPDIKSGICKNRRFLFCHICETVTFHQMSTIIALIELETHNTYLP